MSRIDGFKFKIKYTRIKEHTRQNLEEINVLFI